MRRILIVMDCGELRMFELLISFMLYTEGDQIDDRKHYINMLFLKSKIIKQKPSTKFILFVTTLIVYNESLC